MYYTMEVQLVHTVDHSLDSGPIFALSKFDLHKLSIFVVIDF